MGNSNDRCIVFGGPASIQLTEQICQSNPELLLNGKINTSHFPLGESYSQLQENVRGADVFLVNSASKPVNDSLMDLLIMADAARRASANRITAVVPAFPYQRQDRKDKPRVPISAKLVLDLMEASGINRVLTMDLHTPQIAGMTNLPVDQLYFRPALISALSQQPNERNQIQVIVAPDVGSIKRCDDYAERLKLDLAIISKKRTGNDSVQARYFIGDVNHKSVLIVDDLTESAGTLIEAAKACKDAGACEIFCAITHGCFTSTGYHRLRTAFSDKLIQRLIVSNTVDTRESYPWIDPISGFNYEKHVLAVNVADMFARAIKSIHNNESISDLFV
jgi:ribose-phosphate pyrophosphokinase